MYIVVGATILMALAGGIWFAFQSIRISFIYSLKAEFTAMPADDRELENWLRGYPGVVPHTVWILREGNSLRVTFIQVRDVMGQPPFPELNEQCESLGYVGPDGRFRDYRPPD
jgi:IS4 transposase